MNTDNPRKTNMFFFVFLASLLCIFFVIVCCRESSCAGPSLRRFILFKRVPIIIPFKTHQNCFLTRDVCCRQLPASSVAESVSECRKRSLEVGLKLIEKSITHIQLIESVSARFYCDIIVAMSVTQ